MKHVPQYMWRGMPSFYHQRPPHEAESIRRAADFMAHIAAQSSGDSALFTGRLTKTEAAQWLVECSYLHIQLESVMKALTTHVDALVKAGMQSFDEDFSLRAEAEVRAEGFDIFAVWTEMRAME